MPARHILIPFHDFSAGGTELIAFRLAEAWQAAGRQVDFLLGASDGPMRQRVPQGVSVTVLSPERPRSMFSRVRLGEQMVADTVALAPDLIFIPGNFHFGLARAMKAALPRTPIVAKISNPLIAPPFDSGALGVLTRPALHFVTRGIDWFAAMSAGLAQEAQRQLGHPRVATLYDPNIPDDAPLDFTPRAALASDAPVRLIAIGRLEPQKDWSLAFRTVAELRKSRPVQLDIYGEGWQRNRLEREIAALGLSDCIRLAGFTDDLPSAMRAADLLLISSRYEGGPVVAVEALAQGLPLASTDCSHFLREVLHDPSLGTLARAATPVALAQAASTQLAHPGPSPAAVARAIAPVRMGHAAQAYLDLFDRVSAQAAGQPGSARA